MKDWSQALLIAGLAALTPIHSMLIVTGVLIFLDLITGVWAALKRNEQIKSAPLRRTVSKLFIYHITIISGYVIQKHMLGDLIPVSNIVAGTIGLVELKSILENGSAILGNNLVKLIIERLGSKNDEVKKVLDESKDSV